MACRMGPQLPQRPIRCVYVHAPCAAPQLISAGSVSAGVWGTVCRRVLASLEEIVKDMLAPIPAGTSEN